VDDTDGWVRVRMIGGFEVRRRDGSLVAPGEWRTAKTRDLLRLLVLERGRVVRTNRILDALWPDVDRPHGAASIRTAASRIRGVTDSPCVRRGPGGLVAFGIRSDVDELDDLLRQVRMRRAAGDHAGAVSMLDSAGRLLDAELYTDALDGRCLGDDSWAVQGQEHVAGLQSEIRTLQAESALEVGDVGKAVDLARRAILSDPFWQRPHQVLMRALTALGEADRANRVHDRLQVALREDPDVQPFARTRRIRDRVQWALTDLTPVEPRPGAPSQPAPRLELTPHVPAPGEVGSLEEHMLCWLRERARGTRLRVRAAFDEGRYDEFPVDLTVGSDGTIEVADDHLDVLWSQDA
jgi:DNA-binding SARP family transcriptional activator